MISASARLSTSTTLDNQTHFYSGKQVRAKADHYARVQKRLQRKGTWPSTRRRIALSQADETVQAEHQSHDCQARPGHPSARLHRPGRVDRHSRKNRGAESTAARAKNGCPSRSKPAKPTATLPAGPLPSCVDCSPIKPLWREAAASALMRTTPARVARVAVMRASRIARRRACSLSVNTAITRSMPIWWVPGIFACERS